MYSGDSPHSTETPAYVEGGNKTKSQNLSLSKDGGVTRDTPSEDKQGLSFHKDVTKDSRKM